MREKFKPIVRITQEQEMRLNENFRFGSPYGHSSGVGGTGEFSTVGASIDSGVEITFNDLRFSHPHGDGYMSGGMSDEYVNVGKRVRGVCLFDGKKREGIVLHVVKDMQGFVDYLMILTEMGEKVKIKPDDIELV